MKVFLVNKLERTPHNRNGSSSQTVTAVPALKMATLDLKIFIVVI